MEHVKGMIPVNIQHREIYSFTYIDIGIYRHRYLSNHFPISKIRHKVNFEAEFYSFEFKIPFFQAGYHTKFKSLNLPYYLPIIDWGIVECIYFPSIFARYQMFTVSFRKWLRLTVSISFGDKRYTTSGSTPRAISTLIKKDILYNVIR